MPPCWRDAPAPLKACLKQSKIITGASVTRRSSSAAHSCWRTVPRSPSTRPVSPAASERLDRLFIRISQLARDETGTSPGHAPVAAGKHMEVPEAPTSRGASEPLRAHLATARQTRFDAAGLLSGSNRTGCFNRHGGSYAGLEIRQAYAVHRPRDRATPGAHAREAVELGRCDRCLNGSPPAFQCRPKRVAAVNRPSWILGLARCAFFCRPQPPPLNLLTIGPN